MASRILFRQLPEYHLNFCDLNSNMYLHKNRKYIFDNRRKFACKAPGQPPDPDPCPSRICNKKEQKKSIWKRLFELEEEKPINPPPIECCRARQVKKPDPDLSEFGGKPYKTCGTAYIIQKDLLPVEEQETSKEELILRVMEADPEFKATVNEEPLPKFKNAANRMVDLVDRRLHPLYRKFSGIKKRYYDEKKSRKYKSVTWPIDMHEIPARLNINKNIMDKKNMFVEFKRIEPPMQLIGRIVEINKNAKPSMERRRKNVPVDMAQVEKRQEEHNTRSAVFDTLYQRDAKY